MPNSFIVVCDESKPGSFNKINIKGLNLSETINVKQIPYNLNLEILIYINKSDFCGSESNLTVLINGLVIPNSPDGYPNLINDLNDFFSGKASS